MHSFTFLRPFYCLSLIIFTLPSVALYCFSFQSFPFFLQLSSSLISVHFITSFSSFHHLPIFPFNLFLSILPSVVFQYYFHSFYSLCCFPVFPFNQFRVVFLSFHSFYSFPFFLPLSSSISIHFITFYPSSLFHFYFPPSVPLHHSHPRHYPLLPSLLSPVLTLSLPSYPPFNVLFALF